MMALPMPPDNSVCLTHESSLPIDSEALSDQVDVVKEDNILPTSDDWVQRYKAFWTTNLAGASSLPFPFQTAGIQRSKRRSQLERTAVVPNQFGSSLNLVAQVSWALLVSRYTDSPDVLYASYGKRISYPSTQCGANQLGFLPTRVTLDFEKPISHSIQQFQSHFIDMIRYCDGGIEAIKSINAELGEACNFSNALIFNQTTSSLDTVLEVPWTAIVPFITECIEVSDGIRVRTSFDSDVIDERQAMRVLNQYVHIISQIDTKSWNHQLLSSIDLLCPEDRDEILLWNNDAQKAVETCVHHVIAEKITEYSAKTALYSHDGEISYRQLGDMSKILAGRLLRLGVKPKSFVALCFEKSRFAVVAMLAILQTGAAIVPLDPSDPESRLKTIIEDSGARFVLTSSMHYQKVVHIVESVLQVGPETFEFDEPFSLPDLDSKHWKNPAFVFFTSGSTGKPKGIIISHGAYCTSAQQHSKALRMDVNSRTLQFATYTYDVSMGEIFTTLMNGGCVCIPSDHERLNNLDGCIRDMQVNWLFMTPSTAGMLDPATVPSVQTLVLGGEPATRQNFETWARHVYLINSYGPAECSIWTHCNPGVQQHISPQNIGHKINGLAWVTDVNNPTKLAPIGMVGELVIEGPVLAEGYLKAKEKENAAFKEDLEFLPSHLLSQHGRFYRTGDLVHYNSDGSLNILGRQDTQVKIHGRRVELGEIEFHLRKCLPTHIDIAVDTVTPAGQTSKPMLTAFLRVNSEEDQSTDLLDLRLASRTRLKPIVNDLPSKLQSRLPSHMIPSLFLPVTRIPRTKSGKTSRKDLRSAIGTLSLEGLMAYVNFVEDTPFQEPQTEQEKIVRDLWASVLGIGSRKISAHDSFFRLGGDSLSAMTLVTLFHKIEISLTVADIFTNPRLSDLAMLLSKNQFLPNVEVPPFGLIENASSAIQDAAIRCSVSPAEIEDIYPATPLQEGLFALSLKQHGWYIDRRIFELPSSTDPNRLMDAWNTVARAFSILRTRLIQDRHSNTMQVVLKAGPEWSVIDDNIDSFLEKNQEFAVNVGTPLSQNTLVHDNKLSKMYLVWTAHHALYDAWSLDMTLNSLRSVYDNGPESLTRITNFNLFAKHLSEQKYEAHMIFWRNQFAGWVPGADVISLPPPDYRVTVDETISSSVISLKRNALLDITTSTILRSAWALTVATYTDSTDIVFGITLNGRNAPVPGIEALPAPTITTIPFRTQYDMNENIVQYLESQQEKFSRLIPFEHTGLQRIKSASDEAREACNFQTLFVQHGSGSNIEVQETSLRMKDLTRFEARYKSYPLVIEISPSESAASASISFDSNLFARSQVERILHHYQHIVEQLCLEDEQLKIQDIIRVNRWDMEELRQWNSVLPPPVDLCVHTLMEQRAYNQPEAMAIQSWDGQMTYEELHKESSKLAAYLSSLGVRAEVPVPLCFDKSLYAIVAMVGILKAGGACVPLDPAHPQQRLDVILEGLQAKVLLCADHFAERFKNKCEIVVVGSTLLESLVSAEVITTPLQIDPENAAFILHTSGSTGTPKGIVLDHRCISSSILAHGEFEGLGPHTRALQFASYAFDVSISDIFTTLAFGGCICVAPNSQLQNDLAKVINSMQVNHTGLTPAVANLLDPADVPSLKSLFIGGEALTRANVETWSQRRLLNCYGQAECAIKSAFNTVTSGSDPTNIGNAVGCRLWIVDKDNYHQLMPIGAIGELVVEGAIIARGYLNDPEKTAASFVGSPEWLDSATTEHGMRMFLTGDLVKYNADGTIKYIQRKDKLAKLRGQRFQLEEVEYHLQQASKEIKEVTVDVVKPLYNPDSPVLTAFLCVNIDEKDDYDGDNLDYLRTEKINQRLKSLFLNIRDILSRSLPRYMVPSAFIPLRRLPLTPSRKVDRKLLQSIGSKLSQVEMLMFTSRSLEERTLPQTALEKQLATLWGTLLNRDGETIGRDDDFFQSGADSITAIKLAAAARRFDIILTVETMFNHPKLSDMALMARIVEKHEQDTFIRPFALIKDSNTCIEQAASLCDVNPQTILDIHPCTPLQEGLIALSFTNPGAYVAQMIFKLSSSLHLARFRKAWNEVVDHYPIIVSRIMQIETHGMLQVIIQEPITWANGSSLDSYLAQDKLQSMKSTDPLSRFAIIEDLASSERYFIWTAHHAIYDGWSVSRILQYVEKAYMEEALSPSIQFNTFVKHVQNTDKVSAEEFWRENLFNASPPSFPMLPGPKYRPIVTAIFKHEISQSALQVSSDIPLASQILAAWCIMTAKHSRIHDIVFGLTLSGRTSSLSGIEEIIGPTLATIPFRLKIGEDSSSSQLSQDVAQQLKRLIPYQHVGIHNIRRYSADCQAACDFQTLLNIQGAADSGAQESFLGMTQCEGDASNFSTYALNVLFTPTANGLSVHVHFDPKVIEPAQVEWCIKQFDHVLSQLSANTSETTKIRDIEVISPTDLTCLRHWNKPVSVVRSCVHDLFERRVELQPTKQAIQAWDGELTYSQLDQLSSKLAHHLARLGVGPEVKVPVCFEKSMWTIVALFAILKAGGAFVLMDPSHPVNRLRAVSEDVEATVVLSSHETKHIFADMQSTKVFIVNTDSIENLMDTTERVYSGVTPENAVYVIYTSGSTGNPKGAIIEHQAYSTSALECATALHIDDSSRVLQFASYSFDVSIQEILATLIVGGCVCVPSDFDRFNNIQQVIRDMGVTWMNPTPSLARTLAVEYIPSVQTMVLGGEAPRQDDIDYWASKLQLVNAYGLSECSVTNILNFGLQPGAESRNIGYPVGCLCWVVEPDNHNRLSPLGCVGELIIEGPTLGRGYLNNPDKTAEVFIANPNFMGNGTGSSDKVYKTGDLVRYNVDGSIHYIGRKDSQAKVNGQRIELGEIEYHLRELVPSIEVVAEVVEPSDAKFRSLLVAFVVVGDEKQTATSSGFIADTKKAKDQLALITTGLNGRLSQVMPSYMIPSIYLPVHFIPLSVAGKTDRKQLRNAVNKMSMEEISKFTATSQLRPPSSPMESIVRELWAKNLGREANAIGIDDNYFQLGGDSISAMFLVAAARQHGFTLAVVDIFKHPILMDLSMAIHKADEESPSRMEKYELLAHIKDLQDVLTEAAAQFNVSRENIEDAYPCTPLQDGMIMLSLKSPGTYMAQTAWLLPEFIDITKYQNAWQSVCDQTPILRTRIIQSAVSTIQVVLKPMPISWYEADSLTQYIEIDRQNPMRMGDALIRLAIISEPQRRLLVLTAHHSLLDGWSTQLIITDVKKAYEGGSLIPAPSFAQFTKYAISSVTQASSEFWKKELAGAPAPAFPSFDSQSYQPITDVTIKEVSLFPKNWKSTVPASVLIKAAFSLLLGRYSDTKDVVFGLTLNGRAAPVAGIEQIIGLTVTTVPFRRQFQDDWSMAQLLKDIQTQSTEMLPFEHTGLQNIKSLDPSTKRACEFHTILLIQAPTDSKGSDNDNNNHKVHKSSDDFESIELESSKYYPHALVFECTPNSKGVTINAMFDSSLINSQQMQRMVLHFANILHQVATNVPDTEIKDLDFMSSADQRDLGIWNSSIPAEERFCIHEKFHELVQVQPNFQCAYSTERGLTYQELDQLSASLAHRLIALGVGPEVFVPLCFEKSVWTIVAMMAVWKAGGAVVALDPEHPTTRHEDIIKRLHAKLMLCSSLYEEKAKRSGITTVIVDLTLTQSLSPMIQDPRTEVKANNAAYVVFTSGSTGVPKIIVVEHRQLVTSSTALINTLKLDSRSRVLQFAAYTFDVCYGDICPTLLSGGCVCIPTQHDRLNDLGNAMRSMQVSHAQLTPAVALHLSPSEVPSLKLLAVGGDTLTKEVIAKWASHVDLINIYGPAECTIWCAYQSILRTDYDPANIGRPIGSVAWVVDVNNHEKLAPIGTIGELVIEGPVVARGYLGDEARTQGSFIETPPWFYTVNSGRRPERMYKTGDLVRYAADGKLIFAGRKDTQVKLHGQRIELTEIEYQLRRSLPFSSDVAVELVTGNGATAPILVAFVCAGETGATDVESMLVVSPSLQEQFERRIRGIQAKLASTLPAYMIPSAFIPVQFLPVSASAKLDRKQLRSVASSFTSEQLLGFSTATAAKHAPSTDQEKSLQRMWSNVLKIDCSNIGRDDSFFRLGGDSLAAMKLVREARTNGVELSVSDIFKYPDLVSMTRRIGDLAHVSKRNALVSPQKFDVLISSALTAAADQCGVHEDVIEDLYPCTPLQRDFMKFAKEFPGSYAMQFVYSISDDLDLPRLRRAWTHVTASHSILRTRVVELSAGIFQVALDSTEPCRLEMDLETYLLEDQRVPLRFGQTLNRCAIIDDGKPSGRYLVHTTHHATYDGWSRQLFLEALMEAYEQDKPIPIAPELSFKSFVSHISKIDLMSARNFWSHSLAGCHSKNFWGPLMPGHEPCAQSVLSRTVTFALNSDDDITVATALQGALAVVFSKAARSQEITLMLTLTGRQISVPDVDRIMGPTATVVPLRIKLQETQSITDFLQSLQIQLVDMISFEHLGWESIRNLSDGSRIACDSAIPVVIHPYKQNNTSRALSFQSWKPFRHAPFPFLLDCELSSEGMDLIVHYDEAILGQDTIDSLLQRIELIFIELYTGRQNRLLHDIAL
jgi:amino acid adenylation domain-containing protein